MSKASEVEAQVAVVTGASRGIGRAVALELAKRGHAVLVGYLRDARAADAVVAELRSLGGRALALAADVAQPAQVAESSGGPRRSSGRRRCSSAAPASPGTRCSARASPRTSTRCST